MDLIAKTADAFDVETKEGNRIDATSLANDDVIRFFEELARSNRFVLHGTNAETPYAVLEPRQANDDAKKSGNKNAVYATIIPREALSHAILNEKYILRKLESFKWGEDTTIDASGAMRTSFTAPPEIYHMFAEHDPDVTADGYVYILDKDSFVSAPDAGDVEFHAESSQEPLAICKVSKRLESALYVIGEGNGKDTLRQWENE